MRKYLYFTLCILGLFISISKLNYSSKAQSTTFQKGTPLELNIAKNLSYQYLTDFTKSYGIDAAIDLKVSKVFIDELSMAHTKMQQYYNGLPVFGGETIVHLKSDSSLSSITDALVHNISLDTEAKLSPQDALAIATDIFGCRSCLTAEPKVDLFVMRHKNSDHLAYRVSLHRVDGTDKSAIPVYFIDAHTGEKLWEYNNLQTQTVTLTGTTNYYGTVSIPGYMVPLPAPTKYYLEYLNNKTGTFDYKNDIFMPFQAFDTTYIWNKPYEKSLVDVQYGILKTYNYFKTVHMRNGIDGDNGPTYQNSITGTPLITAAAHYGVNYTNAEWDPDLLFLRFGDGDGVKFGSITPLDVIAHEWTHGVTQFSAKLIYYGQAGALNESMSDVFGAMVERSVFGENSNTWKIAEKCYTPATPGDALRYMDNPHLADEKGYTNDDQPDHYSERYIGDKDNGGNHINSGIPNKVFYLLAKGGSHHLGGSMIGIGADNAAKIWYRALTMYMTSTTHFLGAREATIKAAQDLFGANSADAVMQAWTLCGVVDPAPGDDLITNGSFETSLSPWNSISLPGGISYIVNGNYPKSGTGYVEFGNEVGKFGTLSQVVAIPGNINLNPTLSFHLNVTSSDLSNLQNDKFVIDITDTNNVLLGTLDTFSNMDKTFDGDYVLHSYPLTLFRGKEIKINFRSLPNSSNITVFRLDNVSVKV